MNPKTPQDLDPKLKEAYDRVMGGNFSPTPPVSKMPEIPKTETPAPVAANTAIPPAAPLPNPLSAEVTMPPLSVMSPSTIASTGQPTTSTKKKSGISPIIFLLVGLVFFAIYAVVWAKVFNLF